MKYVCFFLLGIPLFSMANTYEYMQSVNNNGVKYDIHIIIKKTIITVTDHFDPSWSFKDTSFQCNNENKAQIYLRHVDVANVGDKQNVFFISYMMSCEDQSQPPRIEYLAIYKGVQYVMSGIALTASVNDDWKRLSKRKFSYHINDALRNDNEVFNFMVKYWPSQIILVN
ncbi:hypothetical protein FDX19_21870 [Citrobacter sp. wls619]|uniref:hypothetical protein n=1 Tax=Citrobacter sp. wls619 TaxID=2576432 RepID=UPI0010C95CFE|nr:hypothetical protein [Citrobacter sp. wls619]TKV05700.1 hypothetical protein FDX19_21870 [Citrobacter sp. wls619]